MVDKRQPFTAREQNVRFYRMICWGCAKKGPEAYTLNEATEQALKQGAEEHLSPISYANLIQALIGLATLEIADELGRFGLGNLFGLTSQTIVDELVRSEIVHNAEDPTD